MTSRAFLSAEWRYLAMLNYEVDPAIIVPFVPRATELDNWQGRTFVSLVGFRFLNTRVMGLSIPFHRDFEEINLRFYVRHQAGDEWRRGVVFIKEIVPRMAIAYTARVLYNENYVALPTAHEIRRSASDPDAIESVKYTWEFRGAENRIELTTSGPAEDFAEESEQEFIAQHYWGYTRQRDGGSVEYQVEHPAWRRIWHAASAGFHGDAAALYGPQFADVLSRAPSSAFLADGSAVIVRQGRRIA